MIITIISIPAMVFAADVAHALESKGFCSELTSLDLLRNMKAIIFHVEAPDSEDSLERARLDIMKQDLFLPSGLGSSEFFDFIGSSEDNREAVTKLLGPMFFSSCNKNKAITLSCVRASAAALEKYSMEGVGGNPEDVFSDYATYNFGF